MPFGNRFSADAGGYFKLPEIIVLRQLLSTQTDLGFGVHRAEKLHSADSGEQEERARIFRKTRGRRDPGGLGERLGQNDSRDERIAWKVTGEDWVIVRKDGRTFSGLTRFALEQLPNEDEWRSMGELGEVINDM